MAAIINMFEIDNNYQKPEDAKQKEELVTPPSIDSGTETSENLMPIIADSRIYASKEKSIMTSGFVKTNRALALKLAEQSPYASILLQIIALRAERFDCSVTGLKANEAKIDYNDLPTRQIYRSALLKLQVYGFVTIRTTNKFTIAKLCNSEIYDLNNNLDNQQDNQQATIKQPSKTSTRINTKKKESKNNTVADAKLNFGEDQFVELSEQEHLKLSEKHGPEKLAAMIQILDNYIGSKGGRANIKHTSDYHVLKASGWVEKNWLENKTAPKSNKAATEEENYEWVKQFDRNELGWTIKAEADAWRVASWNDSTKNAWIGYKTSGFKAQVQNTLRKFNLWTTSAT